MQKVTSEPGHVCVFLCFLCVWCYINPLMCLSSVKLLLKLPLV